MIHLDQKSFFIRTTRIWNLLITRLDPDNVTFEDFKSVLYGYYLRALAINYGVAFTADVLAIFVSPRCAQIIRIYFRFVLLNYTLHSPVLLPRLVSPKVNSQPSKGLSNTHCSVPGRGISGLLHSWLFPFPVIQSVRFFPRFYL